MITSPPSLLTSEPCFKKAMDCEAEDASREEFANWTVNTPLLYDVVANHILEWPTMTVDCLPRNFHLDGEVQDSASLSDSEITQSCLISTFTGGEEPNFLLLLDVTLPKDVVPAACRIYATHSDYGGFSYGSHKKKFTIRKKIPLENEANRALHMPQRPQMAIVVGPDGAVNLIDLSVGMADGSRDAIVAKFVGHTAEVWAADWNRAASGTLATAADDLKICIWDTNIANGTGSQTPVATFSPHTSAPQDVSWKRRNDKIVASVGDDGNLFIIDCRAPATPLKASVSRHPVNCVEYNFDHDYLLATAGQDKEIILWDDRQLDYSLHRMPGHDKTVSRLAFNPEEPHYLASGSQDRRVNIWDLRRIGMEQRPEDADDGPPELVFSHGGHTSIVNDVCWTENLGERGSMVFSASDDNQLQVWQMSYDLFGCDKDESVEILDDEFEVEVVDQPQQQQQ